MRKRYVMRKNVYGGLISAAVTSVIFSAGAIAGSTTAPVGVPVDGTGPLSCATTNFSVAAVTGAAGEFPRIVPCPANAAQKCSLYEYDVTSPSGQNLSQSLFAVSAEQKVVWTEPSPWVPEYLGQGDSTTGFLKYSIHEYPIRFNSSGTSWNGKIWIEGTSAPRIGTAYIRGGKVDEACLIAGPGVPGNPFMQQAVSKQVVAAGGKCSATLHYNSKNEVVNITNVISVDPTVTCTAGKPTPPSPGKKFKLSLGGEPLQDGVDGRDGITFGTGTTTVYLPSGWAICTAAPCPGTTTYVWW